MRYSVSPPDETLRRELKSNAESNKMILEGEIKDAKMSSFFYLISKHSLNCNFLSLRKQPTFGDATTGFAAKCHLRNEHRNSTLMMHHYPDLGSASDWLNQISHVARPIRSTTQICVVTLHQHGISALVSQTSFGIIYTNCKECYWKLKHATG